jgi:hypothetical protein
VLSRSLCGGFPRLPAGVRYQSNDETGFREGSRVLDRVKIRCLIGLKKWTRLRRLGCLGTHELGQSRVTTPMASMGEAIVAQGLPREYAYRGEGCQDVSLARSRGLGRWLWSGPNLGDHREREEG